MIDRKTVNIIFTLLLVVAFFLGCIAIMVSADAIPFDKSSFRAREPEEVNEDWMVLKDNGDIEEFSQFNEVLEVKEITLSRIFLFSGNRKLDTLSFISNHCAVEVYQDGFPVYSYGFNADGEVDGLLGEFDVNVVLTVIPGEASEVVVRFKAVVPITLCSFYFGTEDGSIMKTVRQSIPLIIFLSVAFAWIIIMATLGIVGRKQLHISANYFHFLIFVLVCSLWMMMNIRVLVRFGLNPTLMSIGAYEMFMLVPVALSLYLSSSFPRLRSLNLLMATVSFLSIVVLNILHFTGIRNIVLTLPVAIGITSICIVTTVVQMIIECAYDRSASTITVAVGIILLAAGSVHQLVRYMDDKTNGYSVGFVAGLSVFIFCQMAAMIRRTFKIIEEGRKADDYLAMAKTDSLTGLGNRRALDLYISEIANSSHPMIRVGCIVCDLNNLKLTNDLYGHVTGDQLIKDFANCLVACFENRGVPFRTGGDEFYILFSDVEVDMSAMMRRLAIGTEGSSTNPDYRISYSSGCYADYVPAHDEKAIWDIIKLADAEMYNQKKLDRQKRAESSARK